jgi:fumarylacetoacetase
MKPLGPMNGKSFATSISPWVVTLEAMAPFATPAPARETGVTSFLAESAARPRAGYDVQLRAELLPTGGGGGAAQAVCTSNLAWMYWTFRDLVAQKTINGCNLNTGDVLATGTVSGVGDHEHGCLMERNKGGKVDIALADGLVRTYLLDGDAIRLTASCGRGVGFGECTGVIAPARPL